MTHVKAHVGTEGNERDDKLAKEGAKLCFDLMEKAAPMNWYQNSLHTYWGNRKQSWKIYNLIRFAYTS